MPQYYITAGTVQCFACCKNPFWMHHFGRAEYQRELPVMTDSLREQAQPIMDQLNAGTITTKEAEKLLDKIWY